MSLYVHMSYPYQAFCFVHVLLSPTMITEKVNWRTGGRGLSLELEGSGGGGVEVMEIVRTVCKKEVDGGIVELLVAMEGSSPW